MQQPTIGSIILYYPGLYIDNKLPNNKACVPGIITHVFDAEGPIHITLFTAQPDSDRASILQRWSVLHKSQVSTKEMPYWDWLPQVDSISSEPSAV